MIIVRAMEKNLDLKFYLQKSIFWVMDLKFASSFNNMDEAKESFNQSLEIFTLMKNTLDYWDIDYLEV
jgi:hypothetical protein